MKISTFVYSRFQDAIEKKKKKKKKAKGEQYMQDHITKTSLFKCIENFTTKKWKFSDKNSDIFSYFCSKHRLW